MQFVDTTVLFIAQASEMCPAFRSDSCVCTGSLLAPCSNVGLQFLLSPCQDSTGEQKGKYHVPTGGAGARADDPNFDEGRCLILRLSLQRLTNCDEIE
jgi:hypothetical protein